jgi:phosphohistidine swiveling domain-containing protein
MNGFKAQNQKKVHTFTELPLENHSKAGGKGSSLVKMYQADLPVPDGFIIQPDAFQDEDIPSEIWERIIDNLQKLRKSGEVQAFAVRSSALSEDSTEASFAGEFETVLNVVSDEEVHEAIIKVHNSGQNERVKAYSKARGIDFKHEVAVIVQKLVYAESSGILFTANPVTGARDQVIITATWGLGEAIVGGLVTPDTLTVNKKDGEIISKEISEKKVMTVRLERGTKEKPVPDEIKNTPVLSDNQIKELNQLGVQIEEFFQMPMDIEWTIHGDKISIVQARPITSLPEPEPPVPTEWKLPSKGTAMRNNIVELMIDPLTPLFGSLGRTSINKSIDKQMTMFFGKSGIMSTSIVLVNNYAYYNAKIGFFQIIEIILKAPWIMNRMMKGAIERWSEKGLPNYRAVVDKWNQENWKQLSSIELLEASKCIMESAISAYMALVSGVIPAAWMTEALFTFTYNRLIKHRDDPDASAFLKGFDNKPINGEKSLYELAEWTQSHEQLTEYLLNTRIQEIIHRINDIDSNTESFVDEWKEWKTRFQLHLKQFGHTIYNLDYSNDTPADNPAPLLETHNYFLSGQGTNPFTRQQNADTNRNQAIEEVSRRHKGTRWKLFKWTLTHAQRFSPLRENGLADVGLGYPLLRQMLQELGKRLTSGNVINKPEDIFWLRQDELENAVTGLDNGIQLEPLSSNIPRRKAQIRAAKRVIPPLMLPQMKILGYDLTRIKTGTKKSSGDILKGVATSAGRVTGIARVIEGPLDFHKMRHGDILVASMTTPAWTPLFVFASAIVTDIGGPLSHGSIIAREYGIPAVLGCGDATKRILSGQMITVDGSEGKVYLDSSKNKNKIGVVRK